MKRYFFILLFVFPSMLYAQDKPLVEKQANAMAMATFKGDVETIIAFTYPKLVEISGGKENMRKLITARMDGLKKQGIISFDGTVGAAGQFYQAGTELHCLLPEEIIIKTAGGRYLSKSYLLGISADDGKSWTFLDVGNMPPDVLQRLVPNFNSQLVIPPHAKPEFLAN